MRRVVSLGLTICCAAAGLFAADILSQVGVSSEYAKEKAVSVVSEGLAYGSGITTKAIKAASPAARAEMATTGIAWMKSYVASPEFKQAYAKTRADAKPDPPSFTGTPEDELKIQQTKDADGNAELQKALAMLPPDQRKQAEEAMKALSVPD